MPASLQRGAPVNRPGMCRREVELRQHVAQSKLRANLGRNARLTNYWRDPSRDQVPLGRDLA